MMENEKSSLHRYAITFTFPELKGGAMYQSATAEASSPGTAMRRAWEEVISRPGVKRKAITHWKMSVVRAES